MRHCRIHGDYIYDACPSCQDLAERAERERQERRGAEEEDREERRAAEERALESRQESDYKNANPGDYECPNCRYITLRREASRCPKCRGAVTPDYWKPILTRERREAEAREQQRKLVAEEWARGEPERRRKAEEARLHAERAETERQEQIREARLRAEQSAAERQERIRKEAVSARKRRFRSTFWPLYYLYILPMLVWLTLALDSGVALSKEIGPGPVWADAVVPGLNGFMVLVAIVNPTDLARSGFNMAAGATALTLIPIFGIVGAVVGWICPTVSRS